MGKLITIGLFVFGAIFGPGFLTVGLYAATNMQNLGNETAIYEDTLIFESQADYTTFKSFLVGNEVALQSFDEVSGTLPIIVKYKMEAPKPLPNPYSEPTEVYGGESPIAFAGFSLGVGTLFLGLAIGSGIDIFKMIKNKRKQNKKRVG
jgi:hypothetical protein